ncbi:MAG TPA: hypothetical protein VGJ55_03495 [Pyrinomonadaceae bacterium]
MLNAFSSRTFVIVLLCVLLAGHVAGLVAFASESGTAGTVIANRAEATYRDDEGTTYAAVSETVTVTILSVSSLVVTPDETESSASVGPQEHITRLFRVCNTGNTTDHYTITRAEVNAPAALTNLYFDNDASGTVTSADALVSVNGSPSPDVLPGACIGVLAIVDTNDSPANSNLIIRLAARSNVLDSANGRAEDEGTIINAVGSAARLASPVDSNLPPLKTVNGSGQAVVTAGTPFTYTIAFRNYGDTAARGVVCIDDLPTELEYVASSLSLDNRNISDAEDADEGSVQGHRVMVQLPQVSPGQVVTISFRARLIGSVPGGAGITNFANLTGQNLAPVTSSTAIVVIDPFGTVFAGRAGSAAPIAGAQVQILLDQDGTRALSIPPGVGFSPNAENINPFTSDGQGHFSFALQSDQLGSELSPALYFMKVTAQAYSARMLQITVQRKQTGLFTLTVHALDGQPLARAGGFDLVRENVRIEDLAALALNIPMFEPYGLELSKAADRPRAEIGDAIAYRLEIHNPTAAPVSDVVVHDRLPASFHYVPGTGRLTRGSTEQPIEPEIAGDEIVFHIGEIGPGESARLLYRARVGANAHEGEQENVAIAAGMFPNGELQQTQPARASVIIGSGVFSTRQIILGRVFVDTNRNGKFDHEDKPMPGVRLYLNSGQSVVTDSEGLYNIPSLGDGPQVLSLDPISLPDRYSLADGGTRAGRSWTRLLRTPLGGGALLRQNFILMPSTEKGHPVSPASAKAKDSIATPSGTGKSPVAVANAEESKTASNNLPTAAGRYEFVTTESVDPVPPGEVKVLSPAANEVVLSAAMQLDARVALNWKVRLEVNGRIISEKSIGTTREDQKNSVSTYTYVGIELRPGPNSVRATAIGPDGTEGHNLELTVLGRGPVQRLEITPEKTEIQANGQDSTTLRVRAYDQWGNPAIDDQVALESSAGQLLRIDEKTGETRPVEQDNIATNSGSQSPAPMASLSRTLVPSTQKSGVIVSLVSGEATVKLIASGAPGEARLHAQMGQMEAEAKVRITPESRPTILVGLAEMTIGQSVPEINLRGEQGNYRSRLSFFFSGRIWKQNLLTIAYDSQRPINRTAGRDRLFQLDPLDRVYPLFGDSSTRYEAAQSNSKLYARLDHKRSYAMFGDLDADMENLPLTGYARKLTGVKVHLENSQGDFVTVTGARPDTAFARDVFPADGFGLLRLSHGEILPGSENVTLEVRDRRNPEIILSRETLARSVDYNLDPVTGDLFFLRYISAFDFDLNLTQLVVTYEHRADSLSSAMYTARAKKNFTGLGLQLGFAGVMQRQQDSGSFILAGFDGEKTLPLKGKLRFAFARSQGEIMGSGNSFESVDSQHNGSAYQLELNQPLPFYQGVARARYSYASAGFFNPFGATVTPGSRRGEVAIDLKPRASSILHLGVTDERNHTATVDNHRLTFSAGWDQIIHERVRIHLGYDHRNFSDDVSGRTTDSNLITASADVKLTDKLQFAVKREQNLGDADPTYPDQTTLAATYQVNKWAKVFFTQRLASAVITPIADFSRTGAGFTSTGARHETAFGVETRVGRFTSMVGRYQLENGINGTDSFAVIGLQNRLPMTKQLSLELGFERGFHLAGNGQSFNSATVGLGWQPNDEFRASARYQFRDRAGMGQIIALGAAGRISEGITALSRFQWSRTGFEGHNGSSLEGMAALAIRPITSDRMGLLFSFNHRSLVQDGTSGSASPQTRDRTDSLSSDGYFQATKRLELYGRVALRFTANGQANMPFVSTLTYLTQARAQYRLTRQFDWAGEMRLMIQPSSSTQRTSYGTELGWWALPDLRLGVGYNFAMATEPAGSSPIGPRRGFYFTITSKLSNLFDLFGTAKDGFVGAGNDQSPTFDKSKPIGN